jgi:4-amino-4-deoxy-L-arabinose transferase-like glycosyltransferase
VTVSFTPDGSDLISDDLSSDSPSRFGATSAFTDGRVAGVVVATIALAIALVAIPNWPVGVFQDDGIYVVLGKALASGEGYRYLNLPGAPYATHYPPGYPLFLALLWKLSPAFPQNVAVFTFANAGFLGLTAFAGFRYARARLGLSTLGAALVAVAGSVSIPALIFGVFVLSEPMFMALLLLALIYAERQAEDGGWREALFVGLAGGALAMVRTTGMFVVPAFALVLLFRRRIVPALCAALGCAVFIVPWHAWVSAHGGDVPAVLMGKYGPYDAWLSNAVREHGLPFVWDVVVRNARALYGMLWVMFTGGESSPKPLHAPAAVAAATLLAVGGWRLARRAPVTAWFLAAYMALVMVWPFEPTRFVWALLPLFAAMLALGIAAVVELAPTAWPLRVGRWAGLAACALLLAGFAMYNVNGVRQRWRDSVPRVTAARATPVVEWVRVSTRPTDIIATEDDPLVYLYTGRRAVPVGTFTPEEYLKEQTYAFAADQLAAIVAQYRPTYVIGTTSYGVISARSLSTRTPPLLRVHTLLPTAAIFAPVAR